MRKLLPLLVASLMLLPFLCPTPTSLSMPEDDLEKRVEYSAGLLEAGIVVGVVEGAFEELCYLVPSLISSAKGLCVGLWELFFHPQVLSHELLAVYHNLKEHSAKEILIVFVPEMQELTGDYAALGDYKRGKLVGRIFGRYGVDFLSGALIAKGIRAYTIFKKASPAMQPRPASGLVLPSLVVHQYAGQGITYLNEALGVIGYMQMVRFKDSSTPPKNVEKVKKSKFK